MNLRKDHYHTIQTLRPREPAKGTLEKERWSFGRGLSGGSTLRVPAVWAVSEIPMNRFWLRAEWRIDLTGLRCSDCSEIPMIWLPPAKECWSFGRCLTTVAEIPMNWLPNLTKNKNLGALADFPNSFARIVRRFASVPPITKLLENLNQNCHWSRTVYADPLLAV